MSLADWNHYQAFLATLETGSLSAAARDLGLTQPTLSRQIAALEESLGEALFVRSQQGLRPTDVALAIAPHVRAMAGEAGALRRAATGVGDSPAGAVRISAATIVGCDILPEILSNLREQYPAIEIELVVTDSVTDILHGEADIGVRNIRPTQAALVARKVGILRSSIYAHRSYLQRCGTPLAEDDLMTGHTLIGFDRETPLINKVATKFGLKRSDFGLRADSDVARLALVRAGAGIGFVPDVLAKGDPELVSILPGKAFGIEVWLAMHEDQRGIARIRTVFDFLAKALLPLCRLGEADRDLMVL